MFPNRKFTTGSLSPVGYKKTLQNNYFHFEINFILAFCQIQVKDLKVSWMQVITEVRKVCIQA